MRVFLAGHNGMVGKSILKHLKMDSKYEIFTAERSELDLTNQDDVNKFFSSINPEVVLIAAAKVGGIYANSTYPADFIYQNLMIESNLIHQSYLKNVDKLIFLGSSCIYPKECEQPISEEMLLTGKLESTNEPYAIAKIAGIKLCESYNRQFNTDFRSLMPTNLYGENDNFHEKNSHVVPALIGRFHKAKVNKSSNVVIWGDGTPLREFLHVDDLARACIFTLNLKKELLYECVTQMDSHLNVGSGDEISILDLAKLISKIVGFDGDILLDKSKPNGTMRKLLNSSKMKNLGWSPELTLQEGIQSTYNWFLENKPLLD